MFNTLYDIITDVEETWPDTDSTARNNKVLICAQQVVKAGSTL